MLHVVVSGFYGVASTVFAMEIYWNDEANGWLYSVRADGAPRHGRVGCEAQGAGLGELLHVAGDATGLALPVEGWTVKRNGIGWSFRAVKS